MAEREQIKKSAPARSEEAAVEEVPTSCSGGSAGRGGTDMAERELKRRPAPQREAPEVEEEAPASTDKAEKLKAELDDLLDEIDEVLEDNAEEFVRNYVQKGGQ